MKNVFLMIGMLTVLLILNGCGSQNKEIAEQPAAKEAEAAAEVTIEEAPEKAKVDVVKPADETATAEAAEEAAQDAVLVTVNGRKITEKEISREVEKRIKAQPDKEFSEIDYQQLHKRVVDRKIERILLARQIKIRGLEIPDEQVLEQINKIATKENLSMEDLEKEIAAKYGMTLEDLKGQIRYKIQTQLLTESLKINAPVTEAEAKKFYEENPGRYERPEEIHSSHILIGVEENATDEQKAEAKAKAEEILVEVKAEGADFAELAKKYSDCESADSGGDLGMFSRNSYLPEYEQVAFSMDIGDISDVVETRLGYHIIKLTDKVPASKESFEEAREQIINGLTLRKKRDAGATYKNALYGDAVIEYSEKERAMRDKLEESLLKAQRKAKLK